jgi:hypothetical protein
MCDGFDLHACPVWQAAHFNEGSSRTSVRKVLDQLLVGLVPERDVSHEIGQLYNIDERQVHGRQANRERLKGGVQRSRTATDKRADACDSKSARHECQTVYYESR